MQALKGVSNSVETGVYLFFIGNAQPDAGKKGGFMKGAEAVLPLLGAETEFFFRKLLQPGFVLIDDTDDGPELFDGALVLGANDFTDDPIEHKTWEAEEGEVAWLMFPFTQGEIRSWTAGGGEFTLDASWSGVMRVMASQGP